MCDIWKDNHNLKQLNEKDLNNLLESFRKFETKQVVMSGGEAMLHPKFFEFCEILKKENIKISLLSTGLTLKKNAEKLVENVNDIIVSVDGDEETHDRIRNIPGAFNKLKEGVLAIRSINPGFRITGRSVIHRQNFRQWPAIIDSVKKMGLNQISFLPADVSSHAFNREILWSDARQHELIPDKAELEELNSILENLMIRYKKEFASDFIAESPEKIRKIYNYYAAFYGMNDFPNKKCNAPWVSAVVEADGMVKPCFFHQSIGNIHERSLHEIMNSDGAIKFRKDLNMKTNPTCVKCVCYLNLPPKMNPAVVN
jgi:MoaA/NifB/PqqE/SkfB family radical SAM enzyme